MSRGRRKAALASLEEEVRGWQADQEMFNAVVAEVAGLNRTDWGCLGLLATLGPLTAGQLAEAAHLTTGAITGVLDHLEAAGLVRRVRDTVDRRRVIVEVTGEVERRGAQVYGPFLKESDEVRSVFGANQLELITDFVRRERGLLTRHRARLHDLLAERG